MFKVSAEHREEYRHILVMFLIGIGIAFPFGIFPEVLQGQQRTSAWNNLFIVGTVVNFFVILAFIVFHYSFLLLVMLALLSFLLPYVGSAVLSMRYLPEVSIRPGLFNWGTIVETSKFSLYAYANTLGNILRNKTDQPVISMILGVAYVKPYQAGGKAGEMFDMFTRQIGDVLSPTAAHLHAKGDEAELRRILIRGTRFSVLIGTPIYLLCATYMDGILRLLTGVKDPSGAMLWTGELLVFWYYSQVMTHAVYKNMAMMAGQEKAMMQQSLAESGLNLVLSIGLTWWIGHAFGAEWGIVGVALGSVVPTFLFGWGWLWGRAAKASGLSYSELFRRVIWRNWAACLPMLGLIALLRLQPFWASGSNTLLVLVEGGLAGLLGLWGNWRFALDDFERRDYASRLGSKLKLKKSRT
jgi:O-antigen/teichoic acid export membrane protein